MLLIGAFDAVKVIGQISTATLRIGQKESFKILNSRKTD